MEPLSIFGKVDNVGQDGQANAKPLHIFHGEVRTWIDIAVDDGNLIEHVTIPNDWAGFIAKGMTVRVSDITD